MFRNITRPKADSVQGTFPITSTRSETALNERRQVPWIKNTLCTTVFIALLLVGLAAYGVFRFGSTGALVAVLRGHVLYAETARIQIGPLKAREQVAARVRLRNLASRSIKLLGSHSSCGCLVAQELPVEFAAGEVKEVSILLTAPASGPAEFEFNVTFYTNVVGEQPQVMLYGRVLPIDAGNDSPRKPG